MKRWNTQGIVTMIPFTELKTPKLSKQKWKESEILKRFVTMIQFKEFTNPTFNKTEKKTNWNIQNNFHNASNHRNQNPNFNKTEMKRKWNIQNNFHNDSNHRNQKSKFEQNRNKMVIYSKEFLQWLDSQKSKNIMQQTNMKSRWNMRRNYYNDSTHRTQNPNFSQQRRKWNTVFKIIFTMVFTELKNAN